jgi:16S rRNA (cytidine1402-2'-O)-methyltransferase
LSIIVKNFVDYFILPLSFMRTPNGSIYLIPNVLAPNTQHLVTLPEVKEIIKTLQYFVVEDVRTARRFISSLELGLKIDDLVFWELGKHSDFEKVSEKFSVLARGKSIGLISEAGCPAVADPGALVVEWGHLNDIKIVPLVGASSILLALMGSGFNGQNFAFSGYLPIDKLERVKALRELEKSVTYKHQTQIFIETPFRNNQLLEAVIENNSHNLRLCIACNLTSPSETIVTKTIKEWKKSPPDLHKKPVVFLLYK